ncbi:MAG: S46 family peptidase [Planctomycetaceae bacterium]
MASSKLCIVLTMTIAAHAAVAEDGMYPMSELPRLNLAEKGIELTADQLFNPDRISLVDGICRVNGCTGSFVSDSGLIITNHHCAYDAIQKASTPQRDLLAAGFSAATRDEEISAPDYQVRITENYRDVSAEVLASVNDAMSFLERTKAIDKRRKELEVAAEQAAPGLRAEVAEMFAGKTYVLFLYTYLKDVRLVFAPPASIGNFGGEVDNWEWPRHTGDFSFMRAYTAPDGTSATYSPQNVPYKPKRFIQVAAQGVDENDVVFLLGYPGRTARHKTAAFLRYEQNVRLPIIVELYNWQIGVMDEAGADDRLVEIKHASRMRSLANTEKRSRGQLLGLRRAKIVPTREQQEAKLQQFINSDPMRSAKYGSLLQDIEKVYTEMSAAAMFEINLVQLRQACRAAAFGYFVYDAAVERAKPNLDREAPYMDRNFPQSVQELQVSMSDWHLPTDQLLLAGMLDRLSELPAASELEPLRSLLAAPGTLSAKSELLLTGTRLGDVSFVQDCLKKTAAELQQIDDPLLQLIIQLYPAWQTLRDTEKARDGRLSQLYGSLMEIKQQFLATDFIPDANSTLRFTSGRIRSYSPADAVIRTPIATLRGVIEKTTGVEPFITPERVLKKYEAAEFGSFIHPRLGQVPVALLYDTDTTGGNSGSPVMNAKGQLVGVNFDRCFEATINDFAWNKDYSRSIGVDIRYVLWITGIVYEADHLLREMGVK